MKKLTFIFLLLLSIGVFGQGGGIYLMEVGQPGIGNASAGAPALARDASVAYSNPAALTEIEDNQLLLGLGIMPLIIDVDILSPANNGNTTTDSSGNGVLPAAGIFWAHKLNDKFTLGATFNNVAGSSLKYEDDWIGRYIIVDGLLAVLNFAPAVGYRLNDQWSFGASLNLYFSILNASLRLPTTSLDGTGQRVVVQDPATDWNVDITGHDLALGFRAGVHFRPTEESRFGLTYRMGNTFDYDGDIELTDNIGLLQPISDPISAEVAIVSGIELGYAQRLGNWDLLFDVGWSNWSSYTETPLNIQLEGEVLDLDEVSGALPRDWKDTWRIALGANYYLEDTWMFQAGISYDSSVVDDERQGLDIPGFAVVRYGLGAQRRLNDKFDLGFHWNVADGIEGGQFTHESALGDVTGKYDKFFLHTMIFSLTYKY